MRYKTYPTERISPSQIESESQVSVKQTIQKSNEYTKEWNLNNLLTKLRILRTHTEELSSHVGVSGVRRGGVAETALVSTLDEVSFGQVWFT